MIKEIKHKLIAGFFTALNSGFIYYLVESKGAEVVTNQSTLTNLIGATVKILAYSFIYVLPIIFIIGIPISILIDFLLKKVRLDQSIFSFILHISVFGLGILLYWGITLGLNNISFISEPELVYNLFMFVYTPGVFWLINNLLKKTKA
ncbi:hypothetical protein M3182_14770 [Mesobacillus maritimus]|uniref:hypothetical protein n=1 Tax=Mesobacillus maritimus TaxID=1643336 RepID=UPI00203FD4B2|nr:hypothetical protein [Mesobacillus maritimus]MCM3586999.1 hypothetical protein [Mesobacillus maritimus]